jgi:hypothetical protein
MSFRTSPGPVSVIFDNLPTQSGRPASHDPIYDSDDDDLDNDDDDDDDDHHNRHHHVPHGRRRHNNNNNNNTAASVAPSIDTTVLASSVGTRVGPTRNAFLKCVAFHLDEPHDLQWDIVFSDDNINNDNDHTNTNVMNGNGQSQRRDIGKGLSNLLGGRIRRGRGRGRGAVYIESISGHLTLSRIQPGDVVTKINRKTIGPSYNAARCMDLVHQLQEQQPPPPQVQLPHQPQEQQGQAPPPPQAPRRNENAPPTPPTLPQPKLQDPLSSLSPILSIQTGNDAGVDTIVQVTVIKPRPDMTAKELGLTVWWWRGLCIHYIDQNSLFAMTPLKSEDELESINDICLIDSVTVADFERIVKELPCEITLIVKRGKQRWTGQFG